MSAGISSSSRDGAQLADANTNTGDTSLQPPTDGISSLVFSSDSSKLLVSSWDSYHIVHLAALIDNPSERTTNVHSSSILHDFPLTLSSSFQHPAAVLTVCFGSSPNIAFSGGLDKRVRQWDFQTGQCRVLGKHDDAISTMVWSPESNVLITGSWDSTLKVWDPSSETPLRSSHTLPSRIYNFSYAPSSSSLLISMAHRHVYVYKVPELAAASLDAEIKPSQQRESALKFLTRSVACMIDGKGWASGSIEGRIAVEYFDPDPAAQALKYAFRAHRQAVDGVDCVYPINALAYHPIHNTFASGGSDGLISIWDHNAKKRMKMYPKYPTAISALAFSPDGSKLAIGASYEHDNSIPNKDDQNRVMVLIKNTVMEDCKPKSKA